MLDALGRIAFWNDSAERIFGYSRDEALGQEAHLLLAPDRYHASYRAAWPRFAVHGAGPIVGKMLELDVRRKDGSEFPAEVSVGAFRLKDRWHAVGVVRDITKRKRREEDLQLFRSLVNQTRDGIYVVDPGSSRFLDANAAACRDLSYTREELLDLGVTDVQAEIRDATTWSAHVRRLKAVGGATLDFRAVRKDGGQFPVEANLQYITHADRAYIVAVVRDTTERKRSEESLRRANRARRTLSACNSVLIYAESEKQLLHDMCEAIVVRGDYKLAWVGIVTQGKARPVRPVASAGFEEGYLSALKITWANTARGKGPTGRAIRLGRPQLARDIVNDPAFEIWREEAIERGYRSSIALPLKEQDGEVFAVLNIYASEAQAFVEAEVTLLEELAGDLSYGVSTLRTRLERNHFQRQHL